MKKDKNKTPLTSFGQMLKKAIAEPMSKENVEKKDDNSQISSQTPQNLKTEAPKPKSFFENTNSKPNSENRENNVQIKYQNPPPTKNPDLPLRSWSSSQKEPDSKPVNNSSNITSPKTPPKTNSMPGKINPPNNNSQNYINLMRKEFWENLDGEAPSGHRGRPLRINLGIDLGTSFSKVVYRLGNESYPVLFGENKNKIEDYLIPSVVVMNKKGIKCKFDFTSDEKLNKIPQIPNFKICLTCERSQEDPNCSITKCNLSNLKSGYLPDEVINEEASFLTSFYLAKLIARAKESVRRQLPEQEIPSDITIKWSANLAVPDKFMESKVAEGFTEALEIAWLMSEVFLKYPNFSIKPEVVICYLAAKELQTEIKMELLLQRKDFDCFIYSEIGAEVASVTLSPTSEEGLYVLVDVGAGTVDTSVFRFHRVDGDKRQDTYAANIFKLGAAQIDARANASFMRKSLNWLRQIKENAFRFSGEDPMIHVTEELKSAEEGIIQELRQNLISVYREAFNKHNNVDTWSKLKLVMGGGGSAIKSYGETAREAFSPKLKDSKLIEFSALKVPQDFHMDTLPAGLFHRFAVAYGLSRDLIELPELTSSSKINPITGLRQKIYIDPTNDG